MSVIDTLITDRTQADVDRARELTKKLNAGTATVEELAEWNSIALKGCYDYTDLNRVSAVVQYLDDILKSIGYITGVSWKQPGRLPAGYTELEYIESSGTQFIDTGFKPNQNTTIAAEFVVLDASNDGAYLYGGGTGTARLEAYPWDGKLEFNYGSAVPFVGTVYANKRFYICQDKTKYTLSYFDGSGEWTGNHAEQSFTSAYTLAIFALNRGTVAYPTSGMKLYSCQIYDNDTLVRDYVPCVNASGEAGLYDLVGEKFYGNSGSGAFAVGPETDTSGSSPNVWTEQNAFTPAYAENYLTNIDRLRSVLTLYETTPKVPDDTENLTVEEANAIEQILVDLDATIKTMMKTCVACGDAYCGGEYL